MITRSKKSAAVKFLDSLIGEEDSFGQFLEALRLSDGLSLSEFAKKLGTSRQQLCDIEKGRRVVSEEKAASFAKRLGYSEQSFIRQVIQDRLNKQGIRMKVAIEAA